MKSLQIISLLSLLLLLLGSVAPSMQAQPAAGKSEPDQIGPPMLPPIEEELCPGEVHGFQFKVVLPRTPAKGDIIFAFDTTGSMGPVITAAQDNAIRIMNDLNNLISDVWFGVMDLEDYPVHPYGAEENEAYRLRQPLTGDWDAVRSAIDALQANSGSDQPEAYTRALYEAYADPVIGWRENARRLLLLFGDSFAHDYDLNEGIPSPPYMNKGYRWETGYPPSFMDPGRDGAPDTADDLDFQAELAQLANRDTTLLSVVPEPWYPTPTQEELVTYWNFWGSQTGGKAVRLWDAGDLPELIRSLVEETIVGMIKRMAVETEPERFSAWVYSDPAEIRDIPIPTDGEISFLGRVQVPNDARAGAYRFRVMVVGDGIVYGVKPVTITVPAECFPVPEYPYWYYLPLVVKNYERSPSK